MNANPSYKEELLVSRPVLKWAGGKGQLLEQITARLPNKLKAGAIKRYIEPFIGGGAVFFEIANTYFFKEAFLFDINPELVILYNVIKNDVKKLIDELENIQAAYYSSQDRNLYYYDRRDEYNKNNKFIDANKYTSDFVRRAALTIFLNRTCFNGLFRVNKKGLFNVPVGQYKNPKILDAENLLNVSAVLQNAIIHQADFAVAQEYANKDTFIYYDPPYRPVRETSSFNSYAAIDFDDAEQERLHDLFVAVGNKSALQMLSNSDPTNYISDPFFDDLYKGFKINRVMAKRLINANADGRNEIRELLITNY
ncbi:MAG: DNA adenine methylase [Deltaproteobacteria bacterium]|jgi:DNA adenine methylase|nr:DNA adenine methylase [Deltaproteobacteria bacterium]